MPDPNNAQSNSSASEIDSQHEFRFKLWDRILATITALGLIIGGAFGLIKYFEQKQKDLEVRKQEYNLAFFKERKDMYYPLCKTVGEIASSKSLAEAEPAIKSFFTLYYGGVHIVSGSDIDEAKKKFAMEVMDFMDGSKNKPPSSRLIRLGENLVEKCKISLALEKVYGITN
jgi:hypothetical protein